MIVVEWTAAGETVMQVFIINPSSKSRAHPGNLEKSWRFLYESQAHDYGDCFIRRRRAGL
jgi:hypothetical protein